MRHRRTSQSDLSGQTRGRCAACGAARARRGTARRRRRCRPAPAPRPPKPTPAERVTSATARRRSPAASIRTAATPPTTSSTGRPGLRLADGDLRRRLGHGGVPVRLAISGLQPITVYHYRLVAVNASGVSSAATTRFKTTASAALAGDPRRAQPGRVRRLGDGPGHAVGHRQRGPRRRAAGQHVPVHGRLPERRQPRADDSRPAASASSSRPRTDHAVPRLHDDAARPSSARYRPRTSPCA